MEEQNSEICFLLGSQQYTSSFLEQLFLEQYSHISLSSSPKLPLFSIKSLSQKKNNYPLYLLTTSPEYLPLRQPQLHLFYYNKMGNNACCEEEAKAGDMIVKSKFQTSKINVQQPHSKLNTINFNDPPKPYKLIHQTVKPQLEKKEEATRRTSLQEQAKSKIPKEVKEQVKSREGELPILSKTKILESNEKNPSYQSQVRKIQTLQRILSPTKQEQEQKIKTSPKPPRQQQRVDDEEEELRRSNLLAPELTPAVRQTLETQDIFIKPNLVIDLKRYDNQFYEGQLDLTKKYPNGFGKFYKEDDSLYVGEFRMGKAHGRGSYIFPNGSYYRGEFKNNNADGPKGEYKSKDLEYQGEFKNNKFHGKGKEKGANHTYQGEYYEGSKTFGILTWTANKQKYQYFGAFEANKFNGQGTLKEPKGTYKGQFIKGKKHGNGVYTFNNGLRYQGEYRGGQRTGKGVLYNPNNKIAYEGQFLKGLPHGDGSIFDANGNKMSTKWIQGIDSDLF